MPPTAPEPLSPEALDAVLARAKAERWTELALLRSGFGYRRESLIDRGWPAAHVFILAQRLDHVPRALVAIESLTSLDLSGNQIGDAGADAIAILPGLTSLHLDGNQIGDAGAEAIARLSCLTSLDLGDNHQIGDAGAEAIAGLSGLTSLGLWRNQIGDAGAEAIASLARLTSLNLRFSGIGDTGAEAIAKLSSLTSLHLGFNLIGDAGAEAIAKLSRLTSLDLGRNRIGDAGADAIARLAGLTSLDLGGNQIGDAGAEAIARLSSLISLDLGNNQIGDVGAEAIATLAGLTHLQLTGNQIGDAGAQAILDAWADPATSDRRRELDLFGENGDLDKLLPAEVREQTDAQALIAAWRQFRDGKLRPLNEAKVLVVGEGNVGKTSLIRYLTTGQPRNPTEPATEGVRAYEKMATERWRAEGSPFTLNIWDFGGQEIYYGTHRYFLTARSLYLLVLDDRTDGPADVEKWLQRIRSHAAGAPVIVVVNKASEGGPGLRLDETELKARYAPIVAFHRTSCDRGNDAKIDALKALILSTIGDINLMPDVQRGYPEPWWRIKDALAERARAQHYVHDHEFRSLCAAHDMVDDSDQRAILATLHNLGTVVAHGLDPEARSVHRETTLLDPNWLTQAIYAILGSARVRDQNGEFALADLATILDPEVHPPRFHEQIVTVMQDARLGLCLRLQGQGERYLLPAALPPSVPEALTAGAYRPCRRYRYASLPGDLLPRFMVQMRELMGKGSARWRDGLVLTLHGCHVLVRVAPADRRLDVGVDASGQHADPRRAIERIEDAFTELHGQFGDIGAKAFVPLLDDPDEEVGLEVLRGLARQGEHVYRHHWTDRVQDIPVTTLLKGVREEPAGAPVEAERGWIDRLASWQGNAIVGGMVGGVAVFLLLPPALSLAPRLGGSLLGAWLFFFALRRLDPELGLMRLLLPLGLAGIPLLLGFGTSLELVVAVDDNPSWLNWQMAPSVLSLVVWAAVMIALISGWVIDRRRNG